MNGGRVRIGQLEIDPVRMGEAVDRIEALIAAGRGGQVFTPNVDHVVRCERDDRFREVYRRADLSLVDGTPLLWASRWLGRPLPEKVSGSDLMLPLMERAAHRRWRVYLLGGQPGAAEEAARRLREKPGVEIAGTDSPRISMVGADESQEALERLKLARPDLVLVALGSPKQELWIGAHGAELAPAVAIGVGAGVEFVAGWVPRAPQWISQIGLEWLYRLGHEPRRLWHRYLVDDPRFLAVLARELLGRNAEASRVGVSAQAESARVRQLFGRKAEASRADAPSQAESARVR